MTAIVSDAWLTTTLVSSGTVAQTEGSLAAFFDPVLAADTIPVAWTDEDNSLHYGLVITKAVTHTQVLTDSEAYAPRVAVDEASLVHLVWRQNDDPLQTDDPKAAIYYTTISRTTGLSSTFELVSDETCPVSRKTEPALAVDAGGAVYVAWSGREANEPRSSGPVCLATRTAGDSGSWTVTRTNRQTQGDRLELALSGDDTLYLLRGVRHPLGRALDELKGHDDYVQEVLYVERYGSGSVWDEPFLVNAYPTQHGEAGWPAPVSILNSDLAVDMAGNAYVVWTDNHEAWETDNWDYRLRTTTIPADAPLPRVTKHYYANGQRIASRVNGDLYYILGDHLGSTSLVVDDTGGEVGHVIYDALRLSSGQAYGQIVENTLPEGLTDRLFTGQIL